MVVSMAKTWQWRDEGEAKGRWRWREFAVLPACYRVLALAPSASAEEIRRTYRRLARSLHPDLRRVGEQAAAHREMAELNAAYATLIDPDRRAAYDRRHDVV